MLTCSLTLELQRVPSTWKTPPQQGWGWAILLEITGSSSAGAQLLGLSWVGAAP